MNITEIKQYLKKDVFCAMLYNLFIALCAFFLCRILFLLTNISCYPDLTFSRTVTLFAGGLRFDLSALAYMTGLYIVLMALPETFTQNRIYQKIARYIWIAAVVLIIFANCADSIYFKFTGTRTTAGVFTEFADDSNIALVIVESLFQYWYVTIAGIAMIYGAIKLYHTPTGIWHRSIKFYITYLLQFMLIACLAVGAMRGGLGKTTRPINLNNAQAYVQKPLESAIVLNTPFSVLRTLGHKPYSNPHYYDSKEELETIFTPVVKPSEQSAAFRPMNVVVLILESFSGEFLGRYTPFLDSLSEHSLTFEYSIANGRKSIDAMPSVLASIPRIHDPYILTVYANNRINSLASCLNKKGYTTAFYHGAPNGSMGFDAFAASAGFSKYYGMDQYGSKDAFDGTWAIWDEPFLQFYANSMSTLQQPFMTSCFTASSHHPFRIPDEYKDIYPESGIHPLHKCIRYTDNALRLFFETASRQEWFDNTLFVITADHTNALTDPNFNNDAGLYRIPIIFYTPDGELQGKMKGVAAQIDIMPTVLGYLNYDLPYVAFGQNLLDSTNQARATLIDNNNTYQWFQDSIMYCFNDKECKAVYNLTDDATLSTNLVEQSDTTKIAAIRKRMTAIIQQYYNRMSQNDLTVE
ncbi:MAG: sulfatase-like hydrolase/transferase [Bacteroidaceae bacterium]|nr:sulfatase-like hydrolase/transferase [Bacteroidaceae bacterium]